VKHFNYVRYTDDGRTDPNGRWLFGVRCMLNGRCICQIARYFDYPPLTRFEAKQLESVVDAIEDEVRDTVDRMDPEVLL
jgi:hypothetical protein